MASAWMHVKRSKNALGRYRPQNSTVVLLDPREQTQVGFSLTAQFELTPRHQQLVASATAHIAVVVKFCRERNRRTAALVTCKLRSVVSFSNRGGRLSL